MRLVIFIVCLLIFSSCASKKDDAWRFYHLGLQLAMDGQYSKAMEDFRIFSHLKPEVHLGLEAMVLIDKMEKGIYPKEYVSTEILATYYEITKLYDKALIESKKGMDLMPNDGMAINNYACALEFLGEFQKSISYLERAIQINPNLSDAYINLIIAYKKLNQPDKAKQWESRMPKVRSDG